MRKRMMILLIVVLLTSVAFAANSPYVYEFPKPDPEWGNAVSFGNLSPGFFQVMFQNNKGVVRIATYGIVGASMDKLKDPQLMMVFAFKEKTPAAGRVEDDSKLAKNDK
ncbi:MAG: hypothetical protein ABIH22_00485 [Candidatus Margulisiibacteriota bacterium]